MANHKELIPFLLKYEGGFSNHPADKGGPTNKGITFRTWKKYCKYKGKKATVESLKNITDEQWEEIYKTMFWDVAKGDYITDQSIANLVVDWLWNSGPVAIRHVQKIVGVDVDGIVARKTLAAINGQSPLILFGAIHKDRLRFVDGVAHRNPSQRRWLNGWHNRINAIQYGTLNME